MMNCLSSENLELVGALNTYAKNIALTGPYMHDGRFVTLEEELVSHDQGDSKPAMGHRRGKSQYNLSTYREREKERLDQVLESLTSEVTDLNANGSATNGSLAHNKKTPVNTGF